MKYDVVCLRPEADFARVGVAPPSSLAIAYRAPGDPELNPLVAAARALVIPAVGPKLPSTLFEMSDIKLVQVTGAGVDRLDEPALRRLGIAVANVPGGSNRAVAEYAVTSASLLLRRFAWSNQEIRAGNYAGFRARMVADNLAGLDGLTVGVIGLGTVGLAVAHAFHDAGCHIVYFDPAPRDPVAVAAIGAQSMTLDQLLPASDVVTLHVPLLPATRGLIGARELSMMKAGAVLIQASRGGIVDEAALAAHLQAGKLGGAAVDVFSSEPPDAANPLLTVTGEAAHKLLLTPHIAGVTRQASALLFKTAWDNVERVLIRDEPPLNRVY